MGRARVRYSRPDGPGDRDPRGARRGDPRRSRATHHRRPDRPERRGARDRRSRPLRGAGPHVEPPRRGGLRRRHGGHAVRVRRRCVHPVRDGRRQRPAGRHPGRPGVRRTGAGPRPAERGDRGRRLGAVRGGHVPAGAVALRHAERAAPRGRTRVPVGGRHDPVRGAGLHLHGGDPRAEDHDLHALRPMDGAADRVDRADVGVLGDRERHRRLGERRVRRFVGARARDRRRGLAPRAEEAPATS